MGASKRAMLQPWPLVGNALYLSKATRFSRRPKSIRAQYTMPTHRCLLTYTFPVEVVSWRCDRGEREPPQIGRHKRGCASP